MARRILRTGIWWLVLFIAWTVMIRTADVQRIGETGTEVGLATMNGWFHDLTGVHMALYVITDWLGLVPVAVCGAFGALGLGQLIQRKQLLKVDRDILLLGVYYVLVIGWYLVFERIPVNYRPVLIAGRLEASYPSSTTLLVLCVMPTLVLQAKRRVKDDRIQKIIGGAAAVFSTFMVLGRLVSGVHWVSDIVGAVLLSRGMFCLYQASVAGN